MLIQMTEQPSLFEYPCDFPIKIMGKAEQDFVQTVIAIVKFHAPDFDAETVSIRASKNGTYLGLTCTIRATSRLQLDELYQTLSAHPLVAVVL